MQFRGNDNACLADSSSIYKAKKIIAVFANLGRIYKMYSDHETYSL